LAIGIFVLSQILASGLYFTLGGKAADLVPQASAAGPATPGTITTGQLVIVLLSQILVIAMTLAASQSAPGGVRQALRLDPPDGGTRAYLFAVVVMAPVIAAINILAYVVHPDHYLSDFKIFLDTARGPWPGLAATAIGAGAPLSEEMLFRGFLLTSATATGLGYWPAAAIVNIAWTALHVQYSIIGILEVFAIGFYLSWTLWRTGSLLVPLVCHAVYNSTLFLVMRYLPIG
jgi:membrane protease YdiL (CAAX protease family)